MNGSNESRVWVLRISPEEYLNLAVDQNIIGVGWSAAKNLDSIDDWSGFKEVIRSAYPELYPSAQSLGNAAGSCWRFIHDMSVDDLVIVPAYGTFYLGTIKSDAKWIEQFESRDFSWQREVEWHGSESIPRDYCTSGLRSRMKARQTCVEASEFAGELMAAKERGGRLRIAPEIRSALREDVMEKVDDVLDPKGLEHLVCALVKGSGWDAVVRPHKQEAGDLDVLARMPLPVHPSTIQGVSEVKVGFQVKKHEGESGPEALAQVRAAIEAGEADFGFIVTSAVDFDESVHKLLGNADSEGSVKSAESELELVHSRIGLINRAVLADWILDVGLKQVQDHFTAYIKEAPE